jgi:hypothetical protein
MYWEVYNMYRRKNITTGGKYMAKIVLKYMATLI